MNTTPMYCLLCCYLFAYLLTCFVLFSLIPFPCCVLFFRFLLLSSNLPPFLYLPFFVSPLCLTHSCPSSILPPFLSSCFSFYWYFVVLAAGCKSLGDHCIFCEGYKTHSEPRWYVVMLSLYMRFSTSED